MKVTLTKIDLTAALSTVGAAIPSRPTHPVLANVKIIADQDLQIIKVIGFDLTLGIKTIIHDAVVDEGGEVCIPFKLLIDIVSKLDGSLSLECKEEDELVTLTSHTGSYELRGMDAEKYPELPTFEGDEPKRIEISVESVKAGLNSTLYAVAGDLTKQILTGVNISSDESSLTFASTDGHRLAMVTLDEDLDKIVNITVPSPVLVTLKSAIAQLDDDMVSIFVNDTKIEFLVGDTEIKARLLEGSYPNYPTLIPSTASRTVAIDRRNLMAALDRIAVIADRKNNIVKFNFQQNKLRLEVDSADVGSGKEALATQSQGDDLLIAFNVKYISETLRNIATTEVVFEMNDQTHPILIKPLGGVNATHLIMPVTIRD